MKNGVVTIATAVMTIGQKSSRAGQFHRRRPVMFSFALSRSSPILDLAPKCARAVAPCVMSGRQWLLGDAHIPKHAQESWDRMPHTSHRYSAKHSPCSPISPWLSAKHSPIIFMFSNILYVLRSRHGIVLSTLHALQCSPRLSAKHSPNFTMVKC